MLFNANPIISQIVRRQLSAGRRRFSAHDADDLTQEIRLRLIQNLLCFDRAKPLERWVARVAINVCRDWARRMHLRYTVNLEPGVVGQLASEVKASEPTDAQQEATRLLRFVPSSGRVIVRLRYWEGLTFEEIAMATDRTPGSVKMQLRESSTISGNTPIKSSTLL